MTTQPESPRPSRLLTGWTPIIGAFSIWFAHFMIAWGAASIWPHQVIAKAVTLVATIGAILALAILFARLRAAAATGSHTSFARRFGLGSVAIATLATLFDALPALA
jgi:hypothetical protein